MKARTCPHCFYTSHLINGYNCVFVFCFFFLSEILIIDLCLACFSCLILLRPQFSDCVIKFARIVMDCDITNNLIVASLTESNNETGWIGDKLIFTFKITELAVIEWVIPESA